MADAATLREDRLTVFDIGLLGGKHGGDGEHGSQREQPGADHGHGRKSPMGRGPGLREILAKALLCPSEEGTSIHLKLRWAALDAHAILRR